MPLQYSKFRTTTLYLSFCIFDFLLKSFFQFSFVMCLSYTYSLFVL